MIWCPFCKRLLFEVLEHPVPTSPSSLPQISPSSPLSSRQRGKYLQIEMYAAIFSVVATENAPRVSGLCFYTAFGKSVLHRFSGISAWTWTWGKHCFAHVFWLFGWLSMVRVVHLTSTTSYCGINVTENNKRTQFSFYFMNTVVYGDSFSSCTNELCLFLGEF